MLINNWPRVPITDVISFIVDNRGKTVPTAESGFPLIATNCVLNERLYPVYEKIRYVSDEIYQSWFRAHLAPNDILFVNKGTPGRCCLVPDPVPFCAAQDMIGLRCDNKKVYYRYLLMVLRSPEIQKKIQNYHVGLAIPHFKKEDLPQLVIPLPSMEEQRIIGDLYFELCEAVENNISICAELEAMSKLLYDYWFVQFDFPDENGKPYKSSGGKMVWNEQLKREIPEGWIVSPLSNYLNCNQNTITQNNLGEYIAYLDTGSLTENVIDQIQTINRSEGLPSRARRVVKENDILYSTVRPIQKHYGIIKHPVENMIASTGFAVLSATQGSSYNELFYLFITSEVNLRILDAIANNSVSSYPSINPDDILNLRIALPPDLTSLRELCRKLQNCYEMIDAEQKENKVLEQLRDFLLPMLMNGQVKV